MANIGNSILPSSDRRILQPINTPRGVFVVEACADQDTHILFFNGEMLASHPNGYSCHNLADRIISVWEGKRPAGYALEQFDYVIRCAGTGNRARVFELVGG